MMMGAPSVLLDEWRRPNEDIRIDIRWLHVLRDVSEQYVAPPRSLRLLLNYIRRLGVREAALKVRSRLAERRRNQKAACVGLGTVREAPPDSGLTAGDAVFFFAPTVAPSAERVVVDRAFVTAASPNDATRGPPSGVLPLPMSLAPYCAWSPFSAVPLNTAAIDAGLNTLVLGLRALPQNEIPNRAATSVDRSVADFRPSPTPSTGKPRVGVFGMGNYAKQLILPNIPPAFELASVHELDPRQLAGWGRSDVRLDASPWPRPDETHDLWFVAGYHCTHAPIALTALERGGAVAIEKPIATTRDQIDALRAALQASPDARLFSCFQRRYAQYNDWIREDLNAVPGSPLNYNCIVYEIPLSPLHWYSWPSSHSRLISNGCHWIDHFMLLNDYADVASAQVIPGAHNGSIAFLALANGAEFTMRLTEIGSPRIGVRDYIEVSLGDRTATIRDAQFYHAEDAVRTLRHRKVSVMAAYRTMYREICRRVLAGTPGDSVDSLKSSLAAVVLDEQYQALANR